MGRSGGGRARKFSDVCLHNNDIVARSILVTYIALWDPNRLSPIYIISSVGTSLGMLYMKPFGTPTCISIC